MTIFLWSDHCAIFGAWITILLESMWLQFKQEFLLQLKLNSGPPLRWILERDDEVFVISGFEVLSTLIANVL